MNGPRIQTVLGDIAPGDLGRTLIHEHLISDLSAYWEPDDAPHTAYLPVGLETLHVVRANPFAVRANLQLDQISVAVAELAPYRAAGGAALVEVTSHGIGRDVRASRMIAEASGLHVIVGCGYYIGASRPRGFEKRTEAELTAELVEELTDGIGRTGIRAGVIGEIGVGSFPMTASERRMLRAAAAAQIRTGAAIVVHPAPGIDSAFELTRVLARAGALMDKVVVAHLDERFRDDMRLFRRIAPSGVIFGFDTFGREIYYPPRKRQHPNDTLRIEAIAALLDLGLGDRITLAQDICLRHELTTMGGQGYAHVLETVVPRLRHRGVSDDAVDRMLIGTPARVLTMGSTAAA